MSRAITSIKLQAALTFLIMMLTFFSCSSASFAQTPFDSQYGPPPTTPPTTTPPPECVPPGEPGEPGNPPDGSVPPEGSEECAEDENWGEGDVLSILPATGGLAVAPFLLAGAGIVATAGIIAIRRRG